MIRRIDLRSQTDHHLYLYGAALASKSGPRKGSSDSKRKASTRTGPYRPVQARTGLSEPGLKKAKKAHPLSPPSGAPRRIGAVVDEERFGSKLDISMKKIELSVNQREERAPTRRRGATIFIFLIAPSMILS